MALWSNYLLQVPHAQQFVTNVTSELLMITDAGNEGQLGRSLCFCQC